MRKRIFAPVFAALLCLTGFTVIAGETTLNFTITPRDAHQSGGWASIEEVPSVERIMNANASGCEFKEGTTTVQISLYCQVEFTESSSHVQATVMLDPEEPAHKAKVGGELLVSGAGGIAGRPPTWSVTGLDIVLDLGKARVRKCIALYIFRIIFDR